MRVPTIDERFLEFTEKPSLMRWLAVREQLLGQPEFQPYDWIWRQLESDFAADAYPEVLALSQRLARFGCLSPRFHVLTGMAAEALGDNCVANCEKRRTHLCLEAILQTGQGTEQSPYLSTYPGDCHDVMRCWERACGAKSWSITMAFGAMY